MCAERGTDLDKVEQTMVGSSASGVEQTMVCCRRTTGATDLYIYIYNVPVAPLRRGCGVANADATHTTPRATGGNSAREK